MKLLGINSLRQLIQEIQGDMSQFTGSVIPTFEEVYSNLETLDEEKADKSDIPNAAVSVKVYCAVTNSYTTKPAYNSFFDPGDSDAQNPSIYNIPTGSFLWTYTEVTYSDGTVYRSEPLCITDGLARQKIATLESYISTLQSDVNTLKQKVASLESMGYVAME